MSDTTRTTEFDVVTDLVAALELYDGLMGGETTTIEAVGEGPRDSVVVVLSNGDEYSLQVRAIRRAS